MSAVGIFRPCDRAAAAGMDSASTEATTRRQRWDRRVTGATTREPANGGEFRDEALAVCLPVLVGVMPHNRAPFPDAHGLIVG
jgi:hypothetical protein